MPEKEEQAIYIRNPDRSIRSRKRQLEAKLDRQVTFEEALAKGLDCMEKEAK